MDDLHAAEMKQVDEEWKDEARGLQQRIIGPDHHTAPPLHPPAPLALRRHHAHHAATPPLAAGRRQSRRTEALPRRVLAAHRRAASGPGALQAADRGRDGRHRGRRAAEARGRAAGEAQGEVRARGRRHTREGDRQEEAARAAFARVCCTTEATGCEWQVPVILFRLPSALLYEPAVTFCTTNSQQVDALPCLPSKLSRARPINHQDSLIHRCICVFGKPNKTRQRGESLRKCCTDC